MGFQTVAIGRGREKEKLAKDLGARAYIDPAFDDAPVLLQRRGSARAILATATSGDAMGRLCSVLQPAENSSWSAYSRTDPIECVPACLAERSGSLTGTPIEL
jgi:D-arabinose 1-dehydrogenase-like Zn-dependent alcohol dehydrogenase